MKRQLKTSDNTILKSFVGEGELWDKLAHRGSGYSNFMNLMKMLDSSLPPETHILVTLSDFPHTFHPIKGHKVWLLRKMPEVIIKLDKLLQD
jgi:hypothetical protein